MALKFEDLPMAVEDLLEQSRQILKLVQLAMSEENRGEDVLNLSQLCDFLDLKKQTVYSYVSKRIIPFHKKAGKLFFFRHEITEWIKAGNQRSPIEGVRYNGERKKINQAI